MIEKLPKFVATSVVRGSRQSESHGGVYTVDFEKQEVKQLFDWNASEIDFKGSSGDRGMRGIAFSDEDILIAASDVLFRCDRSFKIKTFSKNFYLDDCHEICRYEQMIFLTSPGFDSLLAFDLDKKEYTWGFHLLRQYGQWAGHTFDPRSDKGPQPVNDYHINMVHVDSKGIYLSGLQTNALLRIDGKMEVSEVCSLPAGAHNARPFRDGLLFNDTESGCVRYVSRYGKKQAFEVVTYDGYRRIQCRAAGFWPRPLPSWRPIHSGRFLTVNHQPVRSRDQSDCWIRQPDHGRSQRHSWPGSMAL